MKKVQHTPYTDDTFKGWLMSERYNVTLALFCALLPLLISFVNWIVSKGNIFGENYSYVKKFIDNNVHYQVVNLIFIIIALYCLSRMRYIRDKDRSKAENLHEYVKDVFGQNSTLARENSPLELFDRISSGIKQFYYSWVTLWTLWLMLYTEKLVYTIYMMYCTDEQMAVCMFRVDNFIENNLNVISSMVSFFIYMDITMSTVKVGTLGDRGRRDMHIGVLYLIFLSIIFFMVDMFSMFAGSHENYDNIQYVLRLFIGMIATISIMVVLGRLNTSYLRIPQYIIMTVYLYAAIQMCYPMMYQKESQFMQAEILKKSYKQPKEEKLIIYDKKDGNVMHKEKHVAYCCAAVSNEKQLQNIILPERSFNMCETEAHRSIMTVVTYLSGTFAFIGKLALLAMLLWISKRNRFTFFILHKANSLSDTELMLRLFGEYYDDEHRL